MRHTAAQRELLTELVADLNQRQEHSLDTVRKAVRASEARAEAAEQWHVHLAARLDRLEAGIERVGNQAATLRALVGELRSPPTLSSEVAAPGTPLLRVEHLSKEIGGADILTDINFEIYENEILGLIGPNGAGKTTLMECLANLRPRTSGTFYEGDDAPPDWNPSRLMFYLPNGVTPYAELYTLEVLSLFGKLFEIDPSRWEDIIVSELSLGPVLQKKVGALSKGNLQRLLIALALMSPQRLLALDEPFDGLDLQQTHAMMDILRGLRAQNRTLLLCIHQLNDAERICDRLLLLSNGRVVGVGRLDELRERAGLSAGEGRLEDVFLRLTGGRAQDENDLIQAPHPVSRAGMKNS
ncbi:MAG: ABC transporter ATP-binding protein [Chloroflexi bacterium]|nr:ABC transporter ATP-binding protein [Chloroflexota bacterium]